MTIFLFVNNGDVNIFDNDKKKFNMVGLHYGKWSCYYKAIL
jgi:hypothetical protein